MLLFLKRFCLLKQLLGSWAYFDVSQELGFRSCDFSEVLDDFGGITTRQNKMGQMIWNRVVRRPLSADKLASLAPQSLLDMLVR